MKFCTIEINGKEKVAVLSEKNRAVTIESLGLEVNDMNDLIKRYNEVEKKIQTAVKDKEGLDEKEYRILAPIPVPMQDVICLGDDDYLRRMNKEDELRKLDMGEVLPDNPVIMAKITNLDAFNSAAGVAFADEKEALDWMRKKKIYICEEV